MNTRESLQTKLQELLGSNHVYFQPPENIRMKYPCIVYDRSGFEVKLADDKKYTKHVRYELLFITKDPDTNDFIAKVLDSFNYITYVRHFKSDSLNHEVFDLYY